MKTVVGFQPVKIPVLGDIPMIGEILFQQSLPVYGAFLLVPVAWWVLDKTTWGLKIKAVGQNPAAADSLGVSVDRVRYVSVCLGAVAGRPRRRVAFDRAGQPLPGEPDGRHGLHRGGAGLLRRLAAGRASWLGALLFSSVNALQLWMQVLGVKIPSDLAVMLPYVLTIAALAFSANRARQPAALNKPFERGES